MSNELIQLKARVTEEQREYLNLNPAGPSPFLRELIQESMLKEGKCLFCPNEAEHTIIFFDKTKTYDVCDKCYLDIDKALRAAKTSENSCDGYKLKLEDKDE